MKSERRSRAVWVVVFALTVAVSPVCTAQQGVEEPARRARLAPGTMDAGVMMRSLGMEDRAAARMEAGRLRNTTYNWGWLTQAAYNASWPDACGGFPNSQGTYFSHYWQSGVTFAAPAGPWFSSAQAHENWTHIGAETDWEAREGSRGQLFADPPVMFEGYPVYALSTLPTTWPSTGWPVPSDSTIWSGTEIWHKWRQVADQEAYCEFDDRFAGRVGDGRSAPLGITVRMRTLSYNALDIVFIQMEFSNTSSFNYSGCYVGTLADHGGPIATMGTIGALGSYPVFDQSRQLLWYRSITFDTNGDGTHNNENTGEPFPFLGEMYLESPGGSFREFPYDPDNPGTSYLADPTSIISRVALMEYDDRIRSSTGEEAIYGALTAETSFMASGDAENFWKLSQGGGSPVYLQNSQHYQAYNPAWQTISDPWHVVSCGPFDFPAGESRDLVIAFVGGMTEPDMLAAADQAKHIYNLKFLGPQAPPAPTGLAANGITAGPAGKEYDSRLHHYPIYYTPSGDITLRWDHSVSLTTPDPVTLLTDFEGVRIYRSMDRGNTWGTIRTDENGIFMGYVPYVQFDLENGITGRDPIGLVSLGRDTGLQTTWTDPNIMDGIEYWYAITAYDRGEWQDGVQVLQSLESNRGGDPGSPTVIAAIAGTQPNGFTGGLIDGSESAALPPSVLGSPYGTDGTVTVSIASDAGITGHSYRLTTTDSSIYGAITQTNTVGITLEDVTIDSVLYTSLLSEDGTYGSDLLPITDGFSISVNTLWNTLSDAYDLIEYDFSDAPNWSPYSGYEMLYGDSWHPGCELSHTDLGDMSTMYFSAEIRFDTTATQMAYVYNRGGGYYYVGYSDFPGTVWDISADPERQVNLAYTRQSTLGTDIYFHLGGSPLGGNCHFTSILASDYSGTSSDTAYTSGTKSDFRYSNVDHVWSMLAGITPDSLDETALHGQTVKYNFTHPMGAGYEYTFSTTVPSIEDSLIDLDDIRVVPNPYYIYAEWDQSSDERRIRFTNVPADSEIRIYTLTGELVAILDHHGDATTETGTRGYNANRIGTVDWNLWTYEFTEVAYGLYLYIVKTDDGRQKVGKFAIIR